MRDHWTRIVSERLTGLELPDDERDEVIEEVAAHLRECAEEFESTGAADAAQRTLAQVSDWPRLAAKIRRAKETRMTGTEIETARQLTHQTPRRMLVWLLMAAVALGASAGYVVARLTPERYRSQALLQVTPPQVSSDYVRVVMSRPLGDRIQEIEAQILSRTRVERVIKDFNLYSAERASRTIEEVVEDVRNDISIQPASQGVPAYTISVSYTGTDPTTVMKVTERLAGYVKDENQVAAARIAEGTMAFLESQSQAVGLRLQAQQARIAASHAPVDRRSQMDTQVLETTYAKLLADLESARMQVDMERRQIGEQFTLVDQARLPQRPIGPTRAQFVGLGAVGGFGAGLVLVLAFTLARFLSTGRPQPAPQAA